MSDNISLINTVHVHFIRPYILPDFFINLDNLKSLFKFLSEIEAYTNYYTKFEKSYKELIDEPNAFEGGLKGPSFIPEIGNLIPLHQGHTFGSFWFGFRSEAIRSAESFYLMPLRFPLQNLADKWADNRKKKRLNGRLYGYLFPFGVLCINQESVNSGIPLTIMNLIRKNRSNRSTFMEFSNYAAEFINKHLFEPCTEKKARKNHMILFLDKAEPSLIMGRELDEKAIAGLIESDVLFRTSSIDHVSNVLSVRLPKLREGEILIFDPRTTFLQPSRFLREKINPNARARTYNCMRQNYADFLNVTFATNRCIRECMKVKDQMPQSRIEVIKRVIKVGFPKIDSYYSTEYFKNIFPPVSKKIGFNDLLKKFLEG